MITYVLSGCKNGAYHHDHHNHHYYAICNAGALHTYVIWRCLHIRVAVTEKKEGGMGGDRCRVCATTQLTRATVPSTRLFLHARNLGVHCLSGVPLRCAAGRREIARDRGKRAIRISPPPSSLKQHPRCCTTTTITYLPTFTRLAGASARNGIPLTW